MNLENAKRNTTNGNERYSRFQILDAPVDSCCVKRKSTAAADATEDATDGASPEKKSRLEEKCAETENNGDAEEATA